MGKRINRMAWMGGRWFLTPPLHPVYRYVDCNGGAVKFLWFGVSRTQWHTKSFIAKEINVLLNKIGFTQTAIHTHSAYLHSCTYTISYAYNNTRIFCIEHKRNNKCITTGSGCLFARFQLNSVSGIQLENEIALLQFTAQFYVTHMQTYTIHTCRRKVGDIKLDMELEMGNCRRILWHCTMFRNLCVHLRCVVFCSGSDGNGWGSGCWMMLRLFRCRH